MRVPSVVTCLACIATVDRIVVSDWYANRMIRCETWGSSVLLIYKAASLQGSSAPVQSRRITLIMASCNNLHYIICCIEALK
jgi:hypothetical protein